MKKDYEGKIPFTDDIMFSLVMRDEEICRGILEMILPDEEFGEIRMVEGANPLLDDGPLAVETQRSLKFDPDAHGVRFDAFIKSGNIWAEIEMQTYSGDDIGRRARYYQSNMDLDALEQGKRYRNLPRTYIIFICTFDYIGAGEPLYFFQAADCKKGLYLKEDAYKIIINTACSPEKIPEHLRPFFAYINEPDAASGSALVEKIDNRVQKYNTGEWRRKQMTLQELMERKYDMGLAQGISALVKICRSLDIPDGEILARIMTEFGMEEDEARAHMEKISQ